MVTDKFLHLVLLFLFSANFLFAQGVEEQRKYIVSNPDSLLAFVTSSGTLNGLSTHNHSEDVYYDIYLDTPDFSIAQNHLSLRFRKRNLGKLVTYSFQLKSEMENSSGLRMEVEETELDFYTVKTVNRWSPLPVVLDVFFSQLERKTINPQAPELLLATEQLQKWIRDNVAGPIIPFQKLSHLKLKGLDQQSLKTLRPVLFGGVKRLRSHLYIDPKSSTSAFKNITQNRPASVLPKFLFINPQFNWILETSLDFATFYPLIESKTAKVEICEFEVENKYFIPQTGTEVMDVFEKGLKEKFGAANGIDSKYLQSLKKFRRL